MKTMFTDIQAHDPVIAEAKPEIEKCRHYGFCTATCPTYVLLGDEQDSPRGRIDLIHDMLAKGSAPDAETVLHLDRCLSCMNCITTCPTSIDYAKLIDIGREYIEDHYQRPLSDRSLRELIARVLPNPRLFRWCLHAAAAGRFFRGFLGERLGQMLRMTKGLKPERSAFDGVALVRAEGPVRHRVVLLEGCVQKVIETRITDATVRILARHHCEIHKPQDVGCCGSLPLHMGRGDEAKAFARRAVDAWYQAIAEDGIEAIIVNASGCGTTIKDYGHLLNGDPNYAAKAQAVAERTFDIAEWLVKIGIDVRQSVALRVAYHDPCSLQHAQHVRREPRSLLTTAGYEVVDVPESQMCCGSAGTYNMLQPEIASQLGQRKADNVARMKPDVLATGNIGCMTQIGQYSGVPIVHLVELLDWATGGERPAALKQEELAA
ncbi:MAG TPA: glycolate oxidase subunit GlcF [Rhizorhapis sp.]|nr:glycolate oxidase subunit GlcF [Rhizorhapis sp.]